MMRTRFSLLSLLLAVMMLLPSLIQPGQPARATANVYTNATIHSVNDIPDFSGIHPRMFIPQSGMSAIQNRVLNDPDFSSEWQTILNNPTHNTGKAFRYLITGNTSLADTAITDTLTELQNLTDAQVADRGLKYMVQYTRAALVYDWCYDRLSTSQKNAFIQHFMRMLNFPNKPPGFPINQSSNAISSHHSEGWFWNHILIGMAIYDEDDRVWDGAIDFFFNHYQTVRNWFYPSGMHHQGWYLGTRHAHDTLFALLIRQLTGGDIYDGSLNEVPYQLLYQLRPDGQSLRTGDVTEPSGKEEHKVSVLDHTANLYGDEVLKGAKQYFSPRDTVMDAILNILTQPDNLGTQSISSLSPVRFFPEPVGAEMIARGGWDLSGKQSDAFLVQMRIGKYWFGNHHHLDMGTFQLYYKGNLTGDSGSYKGTNAQPSSDHNRHYYRSPIAHNSLLIYNPNQVYTGLLVDPQPDGGIRFPRQSGEQQPRKVEHLTQPRNGYDVADLIAQGTDESNGEYNYAYLSGDLTKGFMHTFDYDNPDRADYVTRSMVTMPTNNSNHPVAFFVFDRLHATNNNYSKKFTMHFAENPVINGNRVITSAARKNTGYDGKLVSWTLLPQSPSFSVVEGYKVGFGANQVEYSPGVDSGSTYEDMKFRLDVANQSPTLQDQFLHAMTVMDDGTTMSVQPQLIASGTNTVGAQLFNRAVIFSKNGALAENVSFQLPGQGTKGVLVADLKPGSYQVNRTDVPVSLGTKQVNWECQCLYFEGSPGTYSIVRTSNTPVVPERLNSIVNKQVTGTGTQTVTVTGLRPGSYLVDRADQAFGTFLEYHEANPACQCLSFQGAPGSYTIARTSVTPEIALSLGATIAGGGNPGDTTAPNVSITSPTNGASVSGTINITANASDNVGVVGVQFKLNGANLGNEDTSPPYSVPWNTTSSSNGNYSLTALARDAAGNTKLSNAVPVTVSNTVGSGILISEDFTSGAGNFTVIAGGAWSAANGKYRLTSPANVLPHGNLSVHNTVVSGNYTAQAVVVNTASSNGFRDGSLIFDYQNSNNYYYVNYSEEAGANPQANGIFKYVNGVLTELANITATTTAGNAYTMKVVRNGANIEAYLNNALVASAADSTFSGGRIGLGTRNDAADFDDLLVTALSSGGPYINEDFTSGAGGFAAVLGGTWGVVNGKYVISSPANVLPHGNLAVHSTNVPGSYTAEAEAKNTASSNGFRDFSLIFDYQNASNYYYVNFSEEGGSNNQSNGVFKYVNGVLTELANITATTTSGTAYTMKVVRSGSSIQAYLNNALVASVTDTAFSGGKIGFGSRNDAVEFDNLLVN